MGAESRDLPYCECPICFKRETPKKQDLLCGECVHDRIEIIRNSVVENERTINALRSNINAVFAACSVVQNGNMSEEEYLDMAQETHEETQPDVIFNTVGGSSNTKILRSTISPVIIPRFVAVKHLALQLQKLDIINTKAKLAGMERTRSSLIDKVASLEDKVTQLRNKINDNESLMHAKRTDLTDAYTRRSDTLDIDTFRLRASRMKHVLKHISRQQQFTFLVLKQVAFSNYEKWKAGRTRKKCVLELFSQPVIPLSLFLSYNSKLETINTFLEHLIYLQVLMVDLLHVTDPVELPYLNTLRNLLPDSTFFDLVQKKFSFIMDDPAESIIETGEVQVEETSDKIVIRDNVIHVPVSFRTMNLQRRLSVKADSGSPGGSPGRANGSTAGVGTGNASEADSTGASTNLHSGETTSATKNNGAIATANPPKSETSTFPGKLVLPDTDVSPKSKVLKGKQIVIVPHKILTKPFSRLLVKEYLRFLLIVVKIVINFHALIQHTVGRVPEQNLAREASRNSLANTINQLRLTSNVEDSECDLEKMLGQLAEMELYFKFMEQEQIHLLDKEKCSRSSSLVRLTPLSSLSFSTEEASESETAAKPTTNTSKVSRFRGFYNFFRKKDPTPLPALDDTVYGLVSETALDSEEKTTDNEKYQSKPYPDANTIMQSVHREISGHGNSRAHSMGSVSDALNSATLSMMAESSLHMDNWDVLSRMH